MRFFFFFFFLFPLLNACNAITVPVIKSVDSVQINSIEGNLVSLKAYLSIENTNQFTISGKELKFNLLYQNISIGTGVCNEKFELKSNSLSQLGTDMLFYLDSIPETLRMGLFEMDSIPINIQISFKGKLGIKHSHTSEFSLPMSMLESALMNNFLSSSEIKLQNLKLESITQTTSKFIGDLSFNNKLPFDFDVIDSEVFVYPEKKSDIRIGDLNLDDSIHIKKDEMSILNCQIFVDNIKAFSTGFGKVLTGNINYYAIGPIHISINKNEFKLPLSIHFSYNPLSGKLIILD